MSAHKRTAEEREKDALVLLEQINRKNGTSLTSDTFPPESVSYGDVVQHFVQAGLSRSDAKNLAWVLTCPRPWNADNINSKSYLSGNCSPYRMWDNFWEGFNNIILGFAPPH